MASHSSRSTSGPGPQVLLLLLLLGGLAFVLFVEPGLLRDRDAEAGPTPPPVDNAAAEAERKREEAAALQQLFTRARMDLEIRTRMNDRIALYDTGTQQPIRDGRLLGQGDAFDWRGRNWVVMQINNADGEAVIADRASGTRVTIFAR